MNRYIENKDKVIELIKNRTVFNKGTFVDHIQRELRLRDNEIKSILEDLYREGSIYQDSFGWIAN